MTTLPYVITISRQLGSGGAYLGQRLADKLGILYLDREIVTEAAKKLKVIEEELESRDEIATSFWQLMGKLGTLSMPEAYYAPPINFLSDRDFFRAETEVIEKVSKEQSAVIVGRGGAYVLKDHQRHLSVFLHADKSFRQKRLHDLYNISEQQARKEIEKSDYNRAKYYRAFTGLEWTDATQYDISIDTSKLGFEEAEKMILDYVNMHFNIHVLTPQI